MIASNTAAGKITESAQPALKRFHYRNGYELECTDWGPEGIRIVFNNPYEGSRSLILPPEKVRECALWMLKSLSQKQR